MIQDERPFRTCLPLLGDRGLTRQPVRGVTRFIVRVVGGAMIGAIRAHLGADGQQTSEGLAGQTTHVAKHEEHHERWQEETPDTHVKRHRRQCHMGSAGCQESGGAGDAPTGGVDARAWRTR